MPRLITRDKWTQPAKPLKAHDTALIVDGNTPRGRWTMSRIIEPIAGKRERAGDVADNAGPREGKLAATVRDKYPPRPCPLRS